MKQWIMLLMTVCVISLCTACGGSAAETEMAPETTEAAAEEMTEAAAEEIPETETDETDTAGPDWDAAAVDPEEAENVSRNAYWLCGYEVGGREYDMEMVKAANLDTTYLDLFVGGTGRLCICGDLYDITWEEDGTICVAGSPIYTFSRTSASELRLDVGDTLVYRMEKRNSSGTARKKETQ